MEETKENRESNVMALQGESDSMFLGANNPMSGTRTTRAKEVVTAGKLTCTSKEKYFFKFLMIMTRKGSLIPSVCLESLGQEM